MKSAMSLFSGMFIAIFVALVSLLTGCEWEVNGEPFGSPSPVPPLEKEYVTEGVKLISPSIQNGFDPVASQQERYALAEDRRLLLRMEALPAYVDQVLIDANNHMTLKTWAVTLNEEAREHLRVCPLKRSWMMLATWDAAHPFDGSGRWAQPGADFDPTECLRPIEPGKDVPATPQIDFDITSWFVNYTRGRGVNFGLVLYSDVPLEIYGDASGAFAPRFAWHEKR